MALNLTSFNDPTLDADYIRYLLEQEALDAQLHYARLWDYFRNPSVPAMGLSADALNFNSRPYVQAQEQGLPARITGVQRAALGGEQLTNLARKEVVIENDIAWRVHTMVDFLFGRCVSIRSLARAPGTAAAVEAVLTALFEANGGQAFFQELALVGSVYGFVDVVLRTPPDWPAIGSMPSPHPSPSPATAPGAPGRGPQTPRIAFGDPASPVTSSSSEAAASADPRDPGSARSNPLARALALIRQVTLETVEATRILPILDENDFRTVRYWLQCFRKQVGRLDTETGILTAGRRGRQASPRTVEVVEIIGPHWFQRYEDRVLLEEGPNVLGRLPLVHVQNVALPGEYGGLSDVESLIPLQDELNTRLSDRATRVTYQSFKMYLAKGIEDFLERPVGPGQMWSTHNMEATVEEFGSDSGSPSEEQHVEQVRQALDKVSGVTGLAAGLVRGNVGNLTSATALKVLLSGLLSRTERKRLTYGRGIAQMVELALALLDRAGVLRSSTEDRRVEIHWPSPLPEDETQRLANAQVKAGLGVPSARVLAELGYDQERLAQ